MMLSTPARGGRWGGSLTWLALVGAVAGIALVAFALVSQPGPAPDLEGPVGSVPQSREAPEPAAESDQGTAADVGPARRTPLGPSAPTQVEIPAIDVRTDVFAIGKAADGTLAVPQPGPDLDKAAWFENSPTPGQPGPSVIEGHVATDEAGPSVFYELATLRPGDRIRVLREDGRTAIFAVDALREFPKDSFPTELVYGGEISNPTLRLITCSNFDPGVGQHTSNLVVFSSLVRVLEA